MYEPRIFYYSKTSTECAQRSLDLALSEHHMLSDDRIVLAKHKLLRNVPGVLLGRVEKPCAGTGDHLHEDGLRLAPCHCLLYTSDAADEEDSVDLGGRRIIKKKKK
eukprot:TRINITY_DN2592_c0_g1_i3.p1 TRINITY_DN2592_c0_g1~~TRINITY_DN2592_c0_g1_i3.p1  ORF type:complete len:106 (-),score=12.95 TRINITY_DN2592_c0_g1_i3:103-420(-)